MNALYLSLAAFTCFANDNDALIPEMWANESLHLLVENMVMANLVHRDFSSEVASFGDVVNTRRPGQFRTQRKTDNDNVNSQDAIVTNVQVPLNQHHYVSFVLKDRELSLSFKDLVATHILPAMQAIARGIDRGLIGQVHKFLNTPTKRAGRLGNLTSSNSKDTLLETRQILNTNKAFADGRNLVLSPASETAILKTDLFVKANERGDGGSALENANLGRILGFNTYLDQNVPFASAGDTASGTVTNALAAGSGGSQATTITGYNVVIGEFLTVAGNDQPTYVTARTLNSADTDAVTLNEVNKNATLSSAALTVYKACAVNGAYDAGHTKEVDVDGFTTAPAVGQLIAFGVSTARRTYTVIESYTSGGVQKLLLDRPLEVALTNDQAAFPGPAGSFNLAFHRDALALVTRPLALAPTRGADSFVAVYNDIAMRATITYDGSAMGVRVTLDLLCGFAMLDENLAAVLLG
jgi:hypothetical protein